MEHWPRMQQPLFVHGTLQPGLAPVCERYGGGGHARVDAISLPPGREDDASKAAAEIASELRAANPVS